MRYEWVDFFKINFYPKLQFKNVCIKTILNALFVSYEEEEERTIACVSLFLDRLPLISVIVQPLKKFF